MDRIELLTEIKAYFSKMVTEKHLYKNQACLYLAFELMHDLAKIDEKLSLYILNSDAIDFSAFSETSLKTILDRLKLFDNYMNKFRKVH